MDSTFKLVSSSCPLVSDALWETASRCRLISTSFLFPFKTFACLSRVSIQNPGCCFATFRGLLQRPVAPSLLTMLRTLRFRIWSLFFVCDVKLCGGKPGLRLFTHNDWGEQKWAQSWKREGLGETAPAASVRPKWTFKDRTGLCRDTRVSLGEFCENRFHFKWNPKVNKQTNKQTNKQIKTASLFSMHGASGSGAKCYMLITCASPPACCC